MAVSFEFTRSCIDNALHAPKIKGQMETKIREYEGSLRRANDRVIRLSKHYDKVKLDHAALKEYRHGSKRIVRRKLISAPQSLCAMFSYN